MRRRLYLLALCCLLAPVGWGQQLLWQWRQSSPDIDMFTDAVTLSDGSVLAAGFMRLSPDIMLVRFTAWGDTLYRRRIAMSRGTFYSIRLCHTGEGKVYAAVFVPGGFGYVLLGRIEPENGTLQWTRQVPGLGPQGFGFNTNRFVEGPAHTLVLAGSASDPLGQAANVGYLACYDTLGVLQWDTVIREHPTNTFCHHVEMTREGNILVSGTAGSRIWAAEYAQDGFEIRRATFYQSQGRINFDYNPTVSVRQAPGDRYVVSGNTLQYASYLGLHQGWAGPRIWGGEQAVTILQRLRVYSDTGISYLRINTAGYTFIKLQADSSQGWIRPFPLGPGQEGMDVNWLASLPDSSAIFVGSQSFRGSAQSDWYAARIANMGVPYRPWQPTVATQAKASLPVPRPYPSPCSNTLRFARLAGPGHVRHYGTDGRLHLSQTVAPGQSLDVSALPPGVYGYVLQGAGKAWLGRVVKR